MYDLDQTVCEKATWGFFDFRSRSGLELRWNYEQSEEVGMDGLCRYMGGTGGDISGVGEGKASSSSGQVEEGFLMNNGFTIAHSQSMNPVLNVYYGLKSISRLW